MEKILLVDSTKQKKRFIKICDLKVFHKIVIR